jgi:hypothetical protein
MESNFNVTKQINFVNYDKNNQSMDTNITTLYPKKNMISMTKKVNKFIYNYLDERNKKELYQSLFPTNNFKQCESMMFYVNG